MPISHSGLPPVRNRALWRTVVCGSSQLAHVQCKQEQVQLWYLSHLTTSLMLIGWPVFCFVLQVCRGVLGPTLSLIQSSGDSSELSSAVALLLQFLRTCPAQQVLLCAAGSSNSEEAGLAAVLAAVRQLLAPTQQDAAVKLAGPLMAQLLKVLPQKMCGPMPATVAAVSNGGTAAGAAGSCVGVLLHDTVAKMAAGTCSASTVSHLLEFVVRLVLLPAVGAQGVVELLAGMTLHRPGMHSSASQQFTWSNKPCVLAIMVLVDRSFDQPRHTLASTWPMSSLDHYRVHHFLWTAMPRSACCADGSSVNALAVLGPQWLDHATDMSGSLQTKHCAAALLELLKLRHHPALAGMQCTVHQQQLQNHSIGLMRCIQSALSTADWPYWSVFAWSCRAMYAAGIGACHKQDWRRT